MCQRILKVLLCVSFLTGLAGGEDDWFSTWGADTPDTAPGGLGDFDRDFQGFTFGFNNPQDEGVSSLQSVHGTVNPFVSDFSPRNFHNGFVNHPNTQPVDPTRRITVHNDIKNPIYRQYPNPPQNYAPNYMQPQQHNHKYTVPNNGPQTNDAYGHIPHPVERYREHSIPVNRDQHRPPNKVSNKIYTPYTVVNSRLNNYENDPVIENIRDDVNANEIRLTNVRKRTNERVPAKHIVEDDDESDENSSEENDEPIDNHQIYNNQQNENFQPQYENYYPQNKPTYYNKPTNQVSDHGNINKYVVYPGPNHENIKIHPDAYQPLRDQISVLKQNQGNTFGGERVEYPEQKPEDEESNEHTEPEGHDIFERQKNTFDSQNANFDQDFNQFTGAHHPNTYVLQEQSGSSDEDENNSNSDESDTFIPVKMYAQVRHMETTKHLPRDAAYRDAVTYDDIINAPRLKEAIKTTKAQTVYTEEGYEDGAYDHAGHLKHASNQEAHGAHAKGNHHGGGAYRDGGQHSYDDGGRSKHGQDLTQGKKWFVDEGNTEDFNNQENFSNKDGIHEFNIHDLTQAGSEKSGSRNTTLASASSPKMTKKVMMSHTIEKRYEDVIRPEDLDGNQEDDHIYYKRLGDESDRHQVLIGDYLKKTMEFNSYIPYLLDKLHGTRKNITARSKDDQNPAQSDVEVFKSDFKLNEGPRHGGNYKQVPNKKIGIKERSKGNNKNAKNQEIYKKPNYLPERNVLVENGLVKNANKSSEEIVSPRISDSSNESSAEASAEGSNEDSLELKNNFEKPKILSEKLIDSPERFNKRYGSNEDAVSEENSENRGNAYSPREGTEISHNTRNNKDDQFPITSEVEVFRADFKKNRGPKHGGNYRKFSGEKRKRFGEASELDDLNSFDDSTRSYLHGGNYKTGIDGPAKEESNDGSESLVSGDYSDSNATTF